MPSSLAQHRPSRVEVIAQGRLGHFEAQLRGSGARRHLHRLTQHVQEVALGHLAGGDVDRHVEGTQVGVGPLPLHDLTARLLQHPFAHRHDEAGLLHRGQELAGTDEPTLGVHPTDEGFDTGHPVVLEGDDGQVEQLELTTG